MKKSELLQNAVLLPLPDGERAAVVEVDGLPAAVRGFTWDSGAGQYIVYINAALSDDQKARTFLHEVSHVVLGHFEQIATTTDQEQEADDRAALLFRLWLQGGTSPELELLNQWTEKRGQVVPLRVS